MSTHEEDMKRAKAGELNDQELDEIAASLRGEGFGRDRYECLELISAARATRFRGLVEALLDSPDDPMISRLALIVLCEEWNEADRYVPELKRFVRGAPWDQEGDVRLVAITTAGEVLRSIKDPELLEMLFDVFSDDGSDRVDREAAYCALARAVGEDWGRLPSAARGFDLEADVDPETLERVRRRLREESG